MPRKSISYWAKEGRNVPRNTTRKMKRAIEYRSFEDKESIKGGEQTV